MNVHDPGSSFGIRLTLKAFPKISTLPDAVFRKAYQGKATVISSTPTRRGVFHVLQIVYTPGPRPASSGHGHATHTLTHTRASKSAEQGDKELHGQSSKSACPLSLMNLRGPCLPSRETRRGVLHGSARSNREHPVSPLVRSFFSSTTRLYFG